MEVETCPYLDEKCGEHAQCVKCKHNTAPGGISRHHNAAVGGRKPSCEIAERGQRVQLIFPVSSKIDRQGGKTNVRTGD